MVRDKYFVDAEYSSPKNCVISLHFRMGDYINLQESHPILDTKYYIKSIGLILNKLKIKSDDKDRRVTILYFNEKEDAIDVIKKNTQYWLLVSDKIKVTAQNKKNLLLGI